MLLFTMALSMCKFRSLIFRDDHEKQRQTGYILTEEILGKIYYNCIIIFVLQLTLVYFAFAQLVKTPGTFIVPESMTILLTRFVCAIILHIQIEGDLKQGISMIEYSMSSMKRKHRKVPQMIVAMMQFIGALLTEIINILLLCSLVDPKDIIINMVAFGVIAELDNFYANSLQSFKLREIAVGLTLKNQDEKPNDIELIDTDLSSHLKDEPYIE